jgi:DNA-binding XRE family transcriptional regulator
VCIALTHTPLTLSSKTMTNAALHTVPNYTICDIITLNIDIILELLYPEEMEVDVAKLKRFREDRVLSQRELARMAGLTHVTVWRLENGFAEAHAQTIRKLAEVLGVEPKELVHKGGQNG